jgi:hypothetical protein
MPIYVPGKAVLAQTYVGIDDPDAAVYIAAVEAADEAESPGVGALETATKVAIHSFVKGCKNDGIWPAIKASCILAGARTLAGALVPLVGAAPTNVGPFVSGDYNRETGLVGNGSTKYLNSNRNNNADPQDNRHISAYVSDRGTQGSIYIGTANSNGGSLLRSQDVPAGTANVISMLASNAPGVVTTSATPSDNVFVGISRNESTGYSLRSNTSTTFVTDASVARLNANYFVFRRGTESLYGTARLAFYSIGESLDLALLDARVTTLINAFAAAIP